MCRARSSLTALRSLVALLPVAIPGSALAQPSAPGPEQSPDSAAAVATVRDFHRALGTADTAAVRTLLAADAVVVEGGGIETREEYLSGHMGADMAFAAAVTREPRLVRVASAGDAAWVVSSSRTTGAFRDRSIDSRGAELVVLARDGERWRIRAIHWSSR